jgi:aryl-alcohol dehydrogenase-like predicted oxidoreductase
MAQLKENLEAFSIALPDGADIDIAQIYRKFRDPPTSA